MTTNLVTKGQTMTTNPANISQLKKSSNLLCVTNGGRSLNAIWNLPFRPNEKIILSYLGSQVDFNSDFTGWRQVSQSLIAERTGLSKRTVMRMLMGLWNRGYIDIYHYGSKSNYYRLTPKLFSRYQTWLDAKQARRFSMTPSDTVSPPPGHGVTPPVTASHTITPSQDPSVILPGLSKPATKVASRSPKVKKSDKKEKKLFTEADSKLARDYERWAKAQSPSLKVNIDMWANEIRLIRSDTGWDHETLGWVLQWIRNDKFWSGNCLSVMGLRKPKRDGTSKLDKIRAQIRQKRDRA